MKCIRAVTHYDTKADAEVAGELVLESCNLFAENVVTASQNAVNCRLDLLCANQLAFGLLGSNRGGLPVLTHLLDVPAQMPTIVFQSSSESLVQRNLRLPPQACANHFEIGVVTYVDPFPIFWKLSDNVFAFPVDSGQQLRQFSQADDPVSPQVHDLTICRIAGRCHEEGVYSVVHVGEVT